MLEIITNLTRRERKKNHAKKKCNYSLTRIRNHTKKSRNAIRSEITQENHVHVIQYRIVCTARENTAHSYIHETELGHENA